jgi:hypothetical protein
MQPMTIAPCLQTDRMEPDDPIDRIEPSLAIDRIEPVDRKDLGMRAR